VEGKATLEVTAMMYGGWGGWGWMMLMPLLWIVLVGAIVWAVVWLAQQGGRTNAPADYGQPRRETPQEILDRRFASGEIDVDAYVEARDRLAGKGSKSS
jgi:putative membrane protein